MKRIKFIYICVVLALVSCASKKQALVPVMRDENTDKLYQALQLSKEAFFALDSAEMIVRDLGWAERFITGAKISEGSLPSVFRGDEQGFSVELPCWESDTNDHLSVTVVTEHAKLDSALIRAKIKGVDELFIAQRIDSYTYADYMHNAMFSCVCITKEKKKYIVNATIHLSVKK